MSASQEASTGPPASSSGGLDRVAVEEHAGIEIADDEDDELYHRQGLVRFTDDVNDALKAASLSPPPPGYPASEPSSSRPASPPPFSSLYVPSSPPSPPPPPPQPDPADVLEPYRLAVSDPAAPAYAPVASSSTDQPPSTSFQEETKRALPRDTKREGASSRTKDDDAEPPPAYSEGSSPLQSFTYLMAAAGGAASIITQVQQGGPPVNAIGGGLPCLRSLPAAAEPETR